jgi:hypothetical protein
MKDYGRTRDMVTLSNMHAATTHASNYSINVLKEVIEDTDKTKIMACQVSRFKFLLYCLWGYLKNKVLHIIFMQWMNLSPAFVKQLHLLMSVNSN